jgi:hypothetical protein
MSGLGTYEGVVLWLVQSCAWWRKRGGRIILAKLHGRLPESWDKLHGNHAPSQCAITCELLVAYASNPISMYVCMAKVAYTAQRIAHTQRMHTKAPHIWPTSAPPRHGPLFPHTPGIERYHCVRARAQQLVPCLGHANQGRNMGRLRAPAMRPIVERV